MTDVEKETLDILNNSFNERGGELVTGDLLGGKLLTPKEEYKRTLKKKAPRKPRKKKIEPDHSLQVDMFGESINDEKFIEFLEALKTNDNKALIENITDGFNIIFNQEI